MRRLLFVLLVCLYGVVCMAQTQNAVVKRNTYLRKGPSTADDKILLLKTGDELELVETETSDDYYHVRTLDGEEGYAYSKNVTVKQAPEKIRTEIAAPSGQPAAEISSAWEKPRPRRQLSTDRKGIVHRTVITAILILS